MTQVTAAETVVQGRPVAVRMELQFQMLWRVDRVTPDGAGELTQTFTRFQTQTTDADGRGTAYDSASAEIPADARELAETLRPLLNTPVQVTITARGELAAVTRPAETESLLGNQPALAGWKRLLTREGFRQLLQPALGVLPPQPVTPGTTWTETREIDLPAGRIRLADRYTYRGLRAPTPAAPDTVAEIEVATQRVETGEKPAADTAPLQPGPYQGTLLFDVPAGRLARSELQQTQAAPAAFRDAPLGLKTTNKILLEIRPATP